MRALLAGLLPLALLALPTGAFAQQPWMDATDQDQEHRLYTAQAYRASDEMMKEWRTAWDAEDARALAKLYTEDAVLIFPDGTMIRGRDAIRKALQERLPKLGSIQSGVVDFAVGGSVAHALGWYEHLGPEADDGVWPASGRQVLALKRRGRSWYIRSQVFLPALSSTTSPAVTPPTGR